MKKITLLLALLLVSVGFAQQTVIQDFEAAGGLGDPFGDAAASVVADPETGGTRGQVAMLSANAGGTVWQGININISGNYELVGNKTMQMDVYSLVAIEFAPKAQGGTDGAPDSVSSAAHTGSGWETLTITYDKSLDSKVPANGVYSQLALHYLWDIANSTWATPDSRVFYIDNIKAIGTVTPTDMTLPASASPAVPASITAGTAGTDYISIFSDDLTSINVGNFDPSWNQATDASVIENEGDNILRYANLNYQGTDFNNDKQDVSGMGFLHLDYHTTNATVLQFFLIVDGQGQESAYDIQANDGITAGSWVSLDIPLSEFTTDLTTLREIKVVGDGTVYFDNWYFHGTATTASIDKNNLSNVSLYPSPAQNELTISAENTIQNVTVYNVLGRKVQSFNVNATSKKLDVSSLSTGIYILKYTANNVVGSMKFIKE